jgi:hypothetical protein
LILQILSATTHNTINVNAREQLIPKNSKFADQKKKKEKKKKKKTAFKNQLYYQFPPLSHSIPKTPYFLL